nr:MAG: penicillin-binding protein 1A [Acidobacteriota bacterium]
MRVRRPSRLLRYTLLLLGGAVLVAVATGAALWVTFARIIDERLAGGPPQAPRVYARPFEIRPGQALSVDQLVARLNEVGYAQREVPLGPGEFAVSERRVMLIPRSTAGASARPVTIEFTGGATPTVSRLVDATDRRVSGLTLEPALLAALAQGERRRHVPLRELPQHVIDAVLAIEDRRFFDHPGVDPIRAVGALVTNLRGDRPYLVGGSTLTQQIVKNTFLTPEKTLRRKLQEQFMAIVLESRLSKEQILELYLNDVVLGQGGPFAIHGVPEAARVFFGKDVRNLSLAEAATIAGLIQSPSRLAPLRYPDRARERRNVVLAAMVESGTVTRAEAQAAAAEPLVVAPRAIENEAPYFVDYTSQLINAQFAGLLDRGGRIDIHTTLDLHLQRLAQEAVEEGMALVDKRLAGRKRNGRPQVALVAVDPRSGEILAMVGGRAYSQTQYNRAALARRQPGSIFKPFVYLAAFEETARGALDLTPATLVLDGPAEFQTPQGVYRPTNYEGEYDGYVTLRAALASSRNIVAVKVAEAAGYANVAALWSRIGVGTPAQPVPSIALGVFEATPIEMAQAYTVFANGGIMRPLTAVRRLVADGRERTVEPGEARRIARPDTTYLVTSMMRSVLDEGSGASARANGFLLEAAGKTGTTNDLRDAWFAGFTPELLTVVWVGFDDNQPLGLSGAQAALPVWTAFMRRALAGRPDVPFDVPDGVVLARIDRETGQLATENCPHVITETFLASSVPGETCRTHGSRSFFSRIGSWFGFGR